MHRTMYAAPASLALVLAFLGAAQPTSARGMPDDPAISPDDRAFFEAKVRPILVEHPFPWGPYGAKGLGETPIIAVAPAVTNAIHHATGARLREIPATPERVFTALRAREEKRVHVDSVGVEADAIVVGLLVVDGHQQQVDIGLGPDRIV